MKMIERKPIPDIKFKMPATGTTCRFVVFANLDETPDMPWVVTSSHRTERAAVTGAKRFVKQYRGDHWFLVIDRETMELLTEDEDASP
jgi:hypothetical protein